MEKGFACGVPGKKSRKIIERDLKVISQSVGREYSLVFKKGKGCNVWDVDGKKYLDFAAGIAVMSAGHCNPAVVKAIKKQLEFGTHAGFCDFYAELPVKYAEFLSKFTPKKFDTVFLSNSGTESVECALKLAKWNSRKPWLIAFKNAFHGRTMGALSMTNSKPVQRQGFEPFLPVKHAHYAYCYRCPFGSDREKCSLECLDALEKVMNSVEGQIAGLFIEAIQGEGGYIVPPKEFLQGVRKLCSEKGVLMCSDEVQAGCYRTGSFLALSGFEVEADIACLGKAIGGGMPIGATIANSSLMKWPSGSHANTFGGNLLACAAGTATLEFLKKNKAGENAVKVGKEIMKRLEEMKEKSSIIGDVRGKGLMIGVEIVKDKKSKEPGAKERSKVLCNAFEKGLLMLQAGESTIRICPPLIISKNEAMKGLNILEESIKKVEKEVMK